MNAYEALSILRKGTYGGHNDFDAFLRFVEDVLFGKFGYTHHQILIHVLASGRHDSLECLAITFKSPDFPSGTDISNAIDMFDRYAMKILCKYASQDAINSALAWAVVSGAEPTHVEILLEFGADPNSNNGNTMVGAAEDGRFDLIKILYKGGGKLSVRMFDSACYFREEKIAYWLYLHGVYDSEYETERFRMYKEEQDEIRNTYARKMQFRVMSKLMKNKHFLLEQGAKRYDSLAERVEGWVSG